MFTNTSLLGLFVANLLISSLICWLLTYGLLSSSNRHRRQFFYFLSTMSTFVPLFGLIAAIFCALSEKFGKKMMSLDIIRLPLLEYTQRKNKQVRSYAAGWASVRLHSNLFNKLERERALISINKRISKDANRLNQELLSDDLDELRLYAFSLLEKQQTVINKKINTLLKAYQKSEVSLAPLEKAQLEKQLALTYWELIYLDLSKSELSVQVLQKISEYATAALRILPEDIALHILLGRVDKGISHLLTAASLGAPPAKVDPYLAELYFNQKDYQSTKKYMTADPSFLDIPKIGKIAEFWQSP